MSAYDFESMLTGGHPNSLGRIVEVVDIVLSDHPAFDELFNCYFSKDEVVRLRVSNAMKRIGKAEPQLLVPYLDRFLTEIAAINQASTQWTLAQLFLQLEDYMMTDQKVSAKEIMRRNLEQHDDWIVLNQSMHTLAEWSAKDEALKQWLLPHLERLRTDSRKSVNKRATKLLKSLSLAPGNTICHAQITTLISATLHQ
ncbi:MAG: hypothetical protein AAFO03_18855 [Bacteroidota bacterium]